MFLLKPPDRIEIESFIASNRTLEFSYPYIGTTKNGFKRSSKMLETQKYSIDHSRILLGRGDDDWERAKQAIRDWKMFDMPWVELCWPNTPIREDQTVAVLIRHFGFYSLNAAKIVYTLDKWERFGFAYGTLADHGESGEERFTVVMDRDTGEVWYDLYAFSRPAHILSKLGYPLARMLQKRFAADSKAAMLHAMRTIG